MKKQKEIPLGIRNNNPGNIRNSGETFIGEVKNGGEFKVFSTMNYGFRAMFCCFNTKIKRGVNTIRGIISEWAPEKDGNDTEGYIRNVCKMTKIKEDKPLDIRNEKDMVALAKAICQQENSQCPDKTIIEDGYWKMRNDRNV